MKSKKVLLAKLCGISVLAGSIWCGCGSNTTSNLKDSNSEEKIVNDKKEQESTNDNETKESETEEAAEDEISLDTSTPEGTVSLYFEKMKSNDMEEMRELAYSEDKDEDAGEEETNTFMEALSSTFAEYTKDITYEIIDSSVDETDATVTVEVTYKDASTATKLAYSNLINKAISSAYSGVELTEEDMSSIFVGEFNTEKETAPLVSITEKFEITCIKADDQWLVSDGDDMVNIYTCNIFKTMNEVIEEQEKSEETSDGIEENSGMTESEETTSDTIDSAYGSSIIAPVIDSEALSYPTVDAAEVDSYELSGSYAGVGGGTCSISIYSSPEGSEIGNVEIDSYDAGTYSCTIFKVAANIYQLNIADEVEYFGVSTSDGVITLEMWGNGRLQDVFQMTEHYES